MTHRQGRWIQVVVTAVIVGAALAYGVKYGWAPAWWGWKR